MQFVSIVYTAEVLLGEAVCAWELVAKFIHVGPIFCLYSYKACAWCRAMRLRWLLLGCRTSMVLSERCCGMASS